MYGLEIGGTCFLVVFVALAVMSGVGGGGVMVPAFLAFFKLSTTEAVALSNFTIFTGSVTRFITNYNERNSERDATCVEYSVANVMLPTVLVGSIFGVWFNEALPEVVTQGCLIVLLAIMSYKTGVKSYELVKKENAAKEKEAQEVELAKVEVVNDDSPSEAVVVEADSPDKIMEQRELTEMQKLAKALYDAEKSHVRPYKHLFSLCVTILLILIKLLRGSQKNPSVVGMERCSAVDWLTVAIYFVLCVGLSIGAVRQLRHEQMLKIEHGEGKLAKGEVELSSNRQIATVIGFSLLGGWICGALGLGGGIIYNTLFMSWDVPPKVATATAMYLITFASMSTTVSYAVSGQIIWSYAAWIASLCLTATAVGMISMNSLMKKIGRQSPIVILLCFIMTLSFVSVAYFAGV